MGPDPDDGQVAAGKRAAYAEGDSVANESRKATAGLSIIAAPLPDNQRLEVTRDFVSWGRGSGAGLMLHAGEIVDARSEIVQALKDQEKKLFRKVATTA